MEAVPEILLTGDMPIPMQVLVTIPHILEMLLLSAENQDRIAHQRKPSEPGWWPGLGGSTAVRGLR